MTRKPSSRSRDTEEEQEVGEVQDFSLFGLGSDTVRGILIVFLFLLGTISLLSFFGIAGPLGQYLDIILMYLFGKARYLLPCVLFLLCYFFLFPERFFIRLSNYIGLILVLWMISALFHLFIPLSDATKVVSEGHGGGYVGLVFSWPLLQGLGVWAGFIVVLCVLIVGFLLAFNTSLHRLAGREGWLGWVLRRFFVIKEGVYEWLSDRRGSDDEEEEVEEDTSFESQEIEEQEQGDTDEEEDSRKDTVGSIAKGLLGKEAKKRQSHPKISLPIDLLDRSSSKPRSGDIEYNKRKIKSTLESFGINVEMGDVHVGPTVTQYTLKPADGIKLSQITTLQNDLSLSLAVHPIRIEAPIPGKALVGIELPNKSVATVSLREIFESDDFRKRKNDLLISLGKDVSGKAVLANLESMPHLLVAGSTGSGKSVCLNTIILSLLYQNQMDQLKMILVDPKRVEFSIYNGIPHLLTPVITDVDKTINALKWAVREMDRRYQVLSNQNCRNIVSYNESLKTDQEKMPYIVIVIDELADLMAVAAQDVEAAIIRLAQMARAVGIHLILSTQRPSVNVITGLIKANITTRIAFTVASQTDSRTILDLSGAEKLLGKGDMLYLSAELSKPRRIQAAYVSENEVQGITRYLKEEGGDPDYEPDVVEKKKLTGVAAVLSGEVSDDEDELLDEAQEVVMRAGKASASLLQRRLRVGYARAARMLDMLEEKGIVGPAEGAKPREVFIKPEQGSVEVSDDTVSEDEE